MKLSHAHADILQHSSSTQAQTLATQFLGQGRQEKKETSILGTPRPYLCHLHLLQYSVQHALTLHTPDWSPHNSHLLPQCPYTRKHRTGAQDLVGSPLDVHPSHGPHSKRSIFWLMVSRSPLSRHGLLQLLCLEACHHFIPNFLQGVVSLMLGNRKAVLL